MKARIALIAAIGLLSAACYTQRPLETFPPPPSTHVIASLTDSGTVALSNAIGPGALELEGVINTASDNAWTVQMVRVLHRDGRTIEWNRELVTFAPNLITRPNVKVLDRNRSWLVAGGITLGAFLVARAFNLVGAPEDEGEEPPPPASVVPVIPGGGK